MKQAKQVIPVRQTFAVRGILFLGVLLLVFLVMHPREGFASAKEGMTLWLNTLLPTLLPFMILTGILIHTGGIEKLLTPLGTRVPFFAGSGCLRRICFPAWHALRISDGCQTRFRSV